MWDIVTQRGTGMSGNTLMVDPLQQLRQTPISDASGFYNIDLVTRYPLS